MMTKKFSSIFMVMLLLTIVAVPSAMAADLRDFPVMFITADDEFDGNIVVGENAARGDWEAPSLDLIAYFDDNGVDVAADVLVLDSNVQDVEDQNYVVIGSPCTNSVAADLRNIQAGEDCNDLEPGQARIQIIEHGENVAVLVYGSDPASTRFGIQALTMMDLQGIEVVVENPLVDPVEFELDSVAVNGIEIDEDDNIALPLGAELELGVSIDNSDGDDVENVVVAANFDGLNIDFESVEFEINDGEVIDRAWTFRMPSEAEFVGQHDVTVQLRGLFQGDAFLTIREFTFSVTLEALEEDDDNDGVINDNDRCADTPADVEVDENGCSAAQGALLDDDGDGVAKGNDQCPGEDDNDDMDNDNIPDECDADIDGDGVANADDNCRLVANADQVDNDNDNFGAACDDDDNAVVNPPNPGDAPNPDPQTKHGELRISFDNLVDEFNDLENEADDHRRDLFDARDDRDDRKIAKYEKKLKKTLRDFRELRDDIEDLEDDVRDERDVLTDAEEDGLTRDLHRLEDDTDDEIDSIENILGLDRPSPHQVIAPQTSNAPVPSRASITTTQPGVIVQPFTGQIPNRNQVVESGMSFRGMAWLIGGIIIILAIIVFLVALLLL